MKQKLIDKFELGADSVLALSGIFSSIAKDAVYAGVSKTGAAVFTSKSLATSSDLKLGATLVHFFASLVTPFNVLDKAEKEALKRTEQNSGNPKLIKTLDDLYDNHKGEVFGATILKAAGSTGRHGLGVTAAIKLYDHWGVMSPAQKSLSIAALSIQTHKTDEGVTVCDTKIISGKDQDFRVKDALSLLFQGKNPYSLVEYWDQISALHKVFDGKPTVEAMSDFAISHNLIGNNIKGSAVHSGPKEHFKSRGAVPVPQYGVGALATPRDSTPPPGYTHVAQTKSGNITVPQPNMQSAMGAIQGSLIGSDAGNRGISSDSAGVYKKWKPHDIAMGDKGVEGGSIFISGLENLKKQNSYLFGALVAFLTKYTHDKVSSSNPVEYAAILAGTVLARLVTGKKEEMADKEGVAVTRQVHDSTPAEWAKVQINLRALYANFRISSKADGYQLTNQAYAENRINESDLVAMHEVLNIIYGDNGLELVQKLIPGSNRGIQIAAERPDPVVNKMLEGQQNLHKEVLANMTKEELRRKNAARYSKKLQQAENSTDVSQEEPSQQPTPQSSPASEKTPQAPSPQSLQMGASA